MKTAIINANVVTAEKIIENGVCVFEKGLIEYVGRETQTADRVIDAQKQYLIPGFIDLHCHGGNGLEFMDASAEEMEKIAQFHLLHGATTMLATTLAASDRKRYGCAFENGVLNAGARYGLERPRRNCRRQTRGSVACQ